MAALAAAALLLGPAAARAQSGSWQPRAVFVQAGTGRGTHQLTLGAAWDWNWQHALGPGRLSAYWEASASGWSYPREGGGQTELGLVEITPVLRFRPGDGASPWFVEAGIGATLMTRVYRTDGKQFSSAYNFGDHLAIGRSFGAPQNHEIALRIEHYSNGGLKEPNPGENFLQLRYVYRMR